MAYRPSNGYNAPGPLPRSALAASGVRVSVGASRVGPVRAPRAPALGRRRGAYRYSTVAWACARAVLVFSNYLREPGRQRELTLAWNTDKTPY